MPTSTCIQPFAAVMPASFAEAPVTKPLDTQKRAILQSVAYLRAFVALLVVMHHMPLQLSRLGYTGKWPELFGSRVDLFFVLSGFAIWLMTYNVSSSPLLFIRNRLSRIVPLYWLLTLLTVMMMLVYPAAVQSGRFDLQHTLATLAFLPSYHPVSHDIAPVLVPGWTLNYEIFFYCVFGTLLPLRPLHRLFVTTVFFICLAALRPVLGHLGAAGTFYTSAVLLEFVLGLQIGAAYTSRTLVPVKLAIALAVCGTAGLIFGDATGGGEIGRVIVFGLPSALLIAGLVFYENETGLKQSRIIQKLSTCSYAIYLSHGIVLSAACQLWLRLDQKPGPVSIALFVVASPMLCISVAVALNHLVAVPINNWLRALGMSEKSRSNGRSD